jgi:hypothetical protein
MFSCFGPTCSQVRDHVRENEEKEEIYREYIKKEYEDLMNKFNNRSDKSESYETWLKNKIYQDYHWEYDSQTSSNIRTARESRRGEDHMFEIPSYDKYQSDYRKHYTNIKRLYKYYDLNNEEDKIKESEKSIGGKRIKRKSNKRRKGKGRKSRKR